MSVSCQPCVIAHQGPLLLQLKHSAAADFVRSMEGAKWADRAVSIGLDPAMMAARKRAGMIQPEWLAAIASTLGEATAHPGSMMQLDEQQSGNVFWALSLRELLDKC